MTCWRIAEAWRVKPRGHKFAGRVACDCGEQAIQLVGRGGSGRKIGESRTAARLVAVRGRRGADFALVPTGYLSPTECGTDEPCPCSGYQEPRRRVRAAMTTAEEKL